MITVSVIVPNYNHAEFLEERINSILEQSYQPYEIILLDDASTDTSRSVIESYRGHKKLTHIIYNDSNSGSPFRQWKKGIELAAGNWIWIAESDDVADPSFLATAVKNIAAYPDTGIFYCDSLIKDKATHADFERFSTIKNKVFQTQKWSHNYFNDGAAELAEGLSVRCTINNASAALMKKDLLLGCLDQLASFRFHGDWFCYLHLVKQSSICYDHGALNTYRSYSSGVNDMLQGHAWDREECFRILEYQLESLAVKNKGLLIRDFSQLYLQTGFWKGKKHWLAYFRINKHLSWKLFTSTLRQRFKGKPRAKNRTNYT